jgi:hypothetical protein
MRVATVKVDITPNDPVGLTNLYQTPLTGIHDRSQLENLMGFDRPINWGEHATICSPFLEPGVTVVDLSGGRSETTDYANAPPGGPANASVQRSLASGEEFQWPNSTRTKRRFRGYAHDPAESALGRPHRNADGSCPEAGVGNSTQSEAKTDPGLHLPAPRFPLGADLG